MTYQEFLQGGGGGVLSQKLKEAEQSVIVQQQQLEEQKQKDAQAFRDRSRNPYNNQPPFNPITINRPSAVTEPYKGVMGTESAIGQNKDVVLPSDDYNKAVDKISTPSLSRPNFGFSNPYASPVLQKSQAPGQTSNPGTDTAQPIKIDMGTSNSTQAIPDSTTPNIGINEVIGAPIGVLGGVIGGAIGAVGGSIVAQNKGLKGEEYWNAVGKDSVSLAKEMYKHYSDVGAAGTKLGLATTAAPEVVGVYFTAMTGKGIYDTIVKTKEYADQLKADGVDHVGLRATYQYLKNGGAEGFRMLGLDEGTIRALNDNTFFNSVGNVLLYGGAYLSGKETYQGGKAKLTKENFSKLSDFLTKDRIKQYKLPETVSLSPDEIFDFYSGKASYDNNLTVKEKGDLMATLGLTNEEINHARRNGISIERPTEVVIKMADKPWFSKIKNLLNIESLERVVGMDSLGKATQVKPTQAPIALLERGATDAIPSTPVVRPAIEATISRPSVALLSQNGQLGATSKSVAPKKVETPTSNIAFAKNTIINKEPIKVYRGEGKGIGNSTYVNGKYFADSKEFASRFGSVSEDTIPAGSKIFDFDTIKNDPKQTVIPKELLVDPEGLTTYLLDNGFTASKNTNTRGVEYVILKDTPINQLTAIAKKFDNKTDFLKYLAGDGYETNKEILGRKGMGDTDIAWSKSRGVETPRSATTARLKTTPKLKVQKPSAIISKLAKAVEETKTRAKVINTPEKPTSNGGIKAYHGTSASFDKFDISRSGATGNGDWSNGIYFTDKKSVAKSFAKDASTELGGRPKVMEVSLDLKNPAKNKDLTDPEIQSAVDDQMGFKDLGKILKKKGFDGIEYTHPDGTKEYVVFDAKKIKTAENKASGSRTKVTPKVTENIPKGKSVKSTGSNIIDKINEAKATQAERVAVIKEPIKNEVKSGAPVAPDFKTASSYEIGKYWEEKERYDLLNAPTNVKVEGKKQAQVSKIVKEYSDLQNKEVPEDMDFVRMGELEDKYTALTGEDLAMFDTGQLETSLSHASNVRDYGIEDVEDTGAAWWSRNKRNAIIGKETKRELTNAEQDIVDIETGRKKFNIPQESLNIVRKYKAKLMRNIPGTEGHLIGDVIGHDSLNNPLLLAHELTHYLTMDKTHVLKLIADPATKAELIKVYKKYYPGSPKVKKTASNALMYNEGMAEFVRQHLFNPNKINKEFPNLSAKFLGDGPLSNKRVSEMYNDVNKMIYIFQNLSPMKKDAALTALELDFKKEGIKSVLVGRTNRIITNSQYGLQPLRILDDLTRGNAKRVNTDAFIVDKDNLSAELMASMARPAQTVALSNLDGNYNNSQILNHKGDVEEILPFNIGSFLKEVRKKGITEELSSYFRAIDSQRDRTRLQNKKSELISLIKESNLEEDSKERRKIDLKITRATKEVNRLTDVVDSQALSDKEQKSIIESNKSRFSEYEERFYKIFEAHLKLKVEDGSVSKKTADKWLSTPGYAPGFRLMVTDVESEGLNSGTRSALSNELKARGKANQPVLNVFSVIPKIHVDTVTKHNAQMLSNYVYEKLAPLGLAKEVGKGTTSGPGTAIYAKNGKFTKYVILDPYIAKSLESVYGKNVINNKFWKGLDTGLRGSARTFQMLTTQLNYYFAIFKNLALDSWTSPLLSETGYVPIVSQTSRFIKGIFNKDIRVKSAEYNKEYERITGGDSGVYELSYDSNNPLDVIKKVSGEKGRIRKGLDNVGNGYKSLLNITERFTRFEEYARARMKGDSIAQAYEKSRNVSGSFHKTGLIARNIVRYVPFSNSGIQIGKQLSYAATRKRNVTKVGAITAVASIAQFVAIASIVYQIDNAETEEERQTALEKAYNYLDKSTYEKVNYLPIGDKYKMAITPIFSSPGTMAGLLMLSDRIPEYKINYGDFGYQVAAGVMPNTITPDISSSESFLKSLAGKFVGALPTVNSATALAGYKTFPGLDPIENKSMLTKAPEDRYKDDTNNLAIMLGRLTGISPVNIEAAIKAQLGTGGGYATDAIGSILMPNATKDELGIIHKDLKTLGFTSPTKSAITQNTKPLSGETSQKIYDEESSLLLEKARLEKINKGLVTKYGEDYGTKGPKEATDTFKVIGQSYVDVNNKIKEIGKIKDALLVVSKYNVRGKEIPSGFINSLNKYILAINSGDMSNVTQDDIASVHKASTAYQNINKVDWSKIPDKAK